jgi:hypothetical protein
MKIFFKIYIFKIPKYLTKSNPISRWVWLMLSHLHLSHWFKCGSFKRISPGIQGVSSPSHMIFPIKHGYYLFEGWK